jgi:GNAT superfamily N-acetyltransferase
MSSPDKAKVPPFSAFERTLRCRLPRQPVLTDTHQVFHFALSRDPPTSQMNVPEFLIADLKLHRGALIQLNVEYASWVMAEVKSVFDVDLEDAVGMPVTEYIPSVLEKVCGDQPPGGIFYLVRIEGQFAGMGGLRRIHPDWAEIKRLYIRPSFRGLKLGDQMLLRLLEDAKNFGYKRVCLESAPFMKAAHHLYERHGFTDCPVYEGVEVPAVLHDRWRFMDRLL